MNVTLSTDQKKLINNVTSWRFLLYLITQLPLGWIVGLKVNELGLEKCVTSVPFRWWNKNPFSSMYFAVQSMAAELSTAAPCLLAVAGQKPSIAFIIVGCQAVFGKKATSRIYFTCKNGLQAFEAIKKCKNTGEPEVVTITTTGRDKEGNEVAKFEFTWSFKQRKS